MHVFSLYKVMCWKEINWCFILYTTRLQYLVILKQFHKIELYRQVVLPENLHRHTSYHYNYRANTLKCLLSFHYHMGFSVLMRAQDPIQRHQSVADAARLLNPSSSVKTSLFFTICSSCNRINPGRLLMKHISSYERIASNCLTNENLAEKYILLYIILFAETL